ncbi:MAG TPA: M48 family metalloprotease, partial [Kofleriaceae bacterium]|nr:M48 family metalloprotease [Kofleriaceae bacterium]
AGARWARAAAVALAGCARASYLGVQLPHPCTAHDVEGCLGWMVERDLADAALDLYDDTALRDYVQRVADRLAQGSLLPRAPRIVIADHDGTYATSGSRIVIGRPTIERLDTEAELAGVLAHELAHIEGRHAVVSLYGPPPGDDQLVLRRDAEAVADERAVALLERAGYTPAAMARALRAVLDAEDDEHPLRADRIARAHVMAGDRLGFEGRAELLDHLEHMVVGRDSRLGRRIGDAWVISALGLALELEPDDMVRDASDVLVLRRGQTALAAYAIGGPWARELADQLADRSTDRRALGQVTLGSVTEADGGDETPVGKLARAIRSTLPQPAIGTRVAIVERPRGALVIELGGRTGRDGRDAQALGLREATPDELAAAEPARIVIERAWRTGTIGESVVCDGRLLDRPERRVLAGDPIKCADRPLASRDRARRLMADAGSE